MQQTFESLAFKIVLIGDPGVGKSSICMKYVQSFIYNQQKNNNVVRNYNATIKVGIWDTTSKPEYKQLRTLAYAGADAFMIIFSLDDRQSFQHAVYDWLNEVKQCCPDATIIFVGNKTDLRYSIDDLTSFDDKQLIERQTICTQIQQINDIKYVQCSALNCEGITDVFLECAKQILKDQKKRKKRKRKAQLLQNCCNKCAIM